MKVDTRPVAPLRANALTRTIYVVALSALVVGSFSGMSGWVNRALGGGVVNSWGRAVPLLFAAAVLYRIYPVVRYRAALDARPPYLFGWLLRVLGWLAMAAGVVGTVSMFL